MLGERPILVRDNPPWVAARPGISRSLHSDLVRAGFKVMPQVECGSHGRDDGLGCFDAIELGDGADLRAVEDWLAAWGDLPGAASSAA